MRALVLGGTGMAGHKVFQVFRERFDTWATAQSVQTNIIGSHNVVSSAIEHDVRRPR